MSLARTKAQIIEQSENLSLQQVMTIRTNRGDEFIINADEAAKALAVLFSEMDNERRFGWSLGTGWYEQEIAALRRSVLAQSEEKK